MTQLKNKVALVTGAGSGQGYATAVTLSTAGASVIGVDVNTDGLSRLESEIPTIRTMSCDVTDPAQAESAISFAEETFGGLDALLNCAGVLRVGPMQEASDADFTFQFDVNVRGVFNMCRAAVPALQRRGGGSIVNWGSVNSVVAESDIALYCATKGAVLMLSKALAIEVAKDDIRVNCLCMSGVRTPLVDGFFDEEFYASEQLQREYQPLGLIDPTDIANVAKFLVSDDSKMMTGSAVMVDGGYTAR